MKKVFSIFYIAAFIMTAIPNYLVAQNAVSARSSIFLTDVEKARILAQPSTSPTAQLLSAMQARVAKRAISPSLTDKTATTEWWHHAAEYLTDAALIHAVRPTPAVDAWLRGVVLDIVRRPVADWAGPGFRGYSGGGEMVGGLETGHLAWGIGIAYDLASDLFTETEREEIKTALREKGMLPCKRYLDRSNFFHNWNCVLLAGYSVAAAVLGDEKALAEASLWIPIAADHFQKDGSYGESLQYGNYAAYSLMIAQEAFQRYNPSRQMTLEPYGRIVNWASYAFLYRKPLSGWPIMDWSQSMNFGDSGSIFRPSGDLLIHIATRGRKEMPQQAGLARWLFDTLYFPANEPGPHDLASFGFVNGFGFLSVIMLADAAPAISPIEAKLPITTSFSGGDAIARDKWGGLISLGVRIPAEPRHASAHLHGDINSFILAYNKERLLVDPGHTCYRNLNRDLDVTSAFHNTCTFETVKTETTPSRSLIQKGGTNRPLVHKDGQLIAGEPIDIGGKRLIASKVGDVSVIGADAAQLYGAPLRTFTRFFVLCGSHALFIVDHIKSDEPLKTTWNFLLNNRDGLLDYQLNSQNMITARRGDAGVKITHFAKDNRVGPIYALMHDAYHTLSGQWTEGKPGSAILMRWVEQKPTLNRTVVHALAIDDFAGIAGWESKFENNSYSIESTDRNEKWMLQIAEDGTISVQESIKHQSFVILENKKGIWNLKSIKQ
ncbi:MAG: heparinase [Paludibacter sp.]|nr:heparinase [Paludibacter sp.]